MSDFFIEQKMLLIKKLEEDKLKDGKISEKNKQFIEFFYKWKELGFYGALREFEKIK